MKCVHQDSMDTCRRIDGFLRLQDLHAHSKYGLGRCRDDGFNGTSYLVMEMLRRPPKLIAHAYPDFAIYIQSSFASVQTAHGLGRHQYYLSPGQLSATARFQYIGEPFGIFAVAVPKIAVTILIIKIMGPSQKGAAWLWFLNIVLHVLSVVCSVALFLQCTPTSAFWLPVGKFIC